MSKKPAKSRDADCEVPGRTSKLDVDSERATGLGQGASMSMDLEFIKSWLLLRLLLVEPSLEKSPDQTGHDITGAAGLRSVRLCFPKGTVDMRLRLDAPGSFVRPCMSASKPIDMLGKQGRLPGKA